MSAKTITLSEKEYTELRLAAAGIGGEWISEEDAMKLTGWKRRNLYQKRHTGELKYRTINGRKIQYSRTQIEKMFTEFN